MCRAHAVYFCFGEKYNAVTYATLVPICLGFALAAGGDPKFEQTGFILAVVSACCLVAVNTISRHTLAFYRSLVGPLQVQAWATSGSFFLLLVPWFFTGVCHMLAARMSACLWAELLCAKLCCGSLLYCRRACTVGIRDARPRRATAPQL